MFVTWGFAAAQSVPGSAVAGSAGGSRLDPDDEEEENDVHIEREGGKGGDLPASTRDFA